MQKKDPKKKPPKQLSSELKPSEIKAHEELAHEDRDPIYPIDPIVDFNKIKKRGS